MGIHFLMTYPTVYAPVCVCVRQSVCMHLGGRRKRKRGGKCTWCLGDFTPPSCVSAVCRVCGRRSSLPRVSALCEADITWLLWQEQYRIQLPFSEGQLLCVRCLNICLCVHTWPQSLTALNTAVNTLHLHLFLFFFPFVQSFASPFFIFFYWCSNVSIKDNFNRASFIHFAPSCPSHTHANPSLPVSSDPFPAEKIEGKPLLRQNCSPPLSAF